MKHVEFEPSRLKRRGHPPRRTFLELAEEIGVPPGVLSQAMGQDPSHPQPVLNRNDGTVRNKWYDRKAFLQWWASRK